MRVLLALAFSFVLMSVFCLRSEQALAKGRFIHTAAVCRAKVKVKAKLEECLACVKDGGKFHFIPGAKHGGCIKK
jgi:hypothetical protein